MLDGEEVHLKPGDKLLVERGAWHSFSTVNGAIFEEVSATRIKGTRTTTIHVSPAAIDGAQNSAGRLVALKSGDV